MTTYTLNHKQSGITQSSSTASDVTVSGSQLIAIAETIADSATFDRTIIIDVSAIKGVYLISSQDVAFHCNTSDNEIDLVAGIPYIWTTSSYDANQLTVDATAIHVTNASGEDADFEMQIVLDATP